MLRSVGAVVAAAGAVLALAAAAGAGPPPNNVQVLDNEFNPALSEQILGSSTIWSWQPTVQEQHNVRQDSKLFYSGEATDDPKTAYSALVPAGKFPYYCEVHGTQMDGEVRVTPTNGPVGDDQFEVIWGNSDFQGQVPYEVQYDVQYRVGSGDWKTWRKDTAKVSRVFGANDDPVDVKPGKTYRFRARTEKASNPKKRSGYSPQLKVDVPVR